MIQDNSRVSLHNGMHAPAMEVYPGGHLLSIGARKLDTARVLDRTIETRSDTVCLLLGNGQKLTGSRDQKVAVYRNKTVGFRELADVAIGDKLRGEVSGMPVVVTVIGLGFDYKPIRLVGFKLENKKNFIAQGVLCR